MDVAVVRETPAYDKEIKGTGFRYSEPVGRIKALKIFYVRDCKEK